MIETLIGQRYRIRALIGEGGMASVYSAMDEKLERRVAIKILHPHLGRNNDIRERFLLEAKTVSGLDHPNIIRVYDFSGLDSEQLWMVTEILYGEDLAEYVKPFSKQRLQFIVATLITREICRALHEAHKLNIVHRDIKPENIMMLANGQIKLMDFGIAKVSRVNATQTGIFMGSPSYMSPEQIRGTDVDHRADIYSLSVLYYEIITGSLPFVGKTTAEVINRIMVGRYTPPNMLITDLPYALNQIIVKGMQGHKEERYQSVAELGQALDMFLTNCQMRESRTELEEFSQNRAKFEERLSHIISSKPKGPATVAVPSEEMSPTFRSKITRYHASYEDQLKEMEVADKAAMIDHLSPKSPDGEFQEEPTSTMIIDEGGEPTLAPMREAKAAAAVAAAALAQAEKAVEDMKPKVASSPVLQKEQQAAQNSAQQYQNLTLNQAQQNQQRAQSQANDSAIKTVAPQKQRQQTGGNFQSPMRSNTQPPKTPQSSHRTTQQRGYYREFEGDDKKSGKGNFGIITLFVLIAAAILAYVLGGDKLLNKIPKRDGIRSGEVARQPKKPKVEEQVALAPAPTPEAPKPEETLSPAPTPAPGPGSGPQTTATPIEAPNVVQTNDGKNKPKLPKTVVAPTVKPSIFAPKTAVVAKAEPSPAPTPGKPEPATPVSLGGEKPANDPVPETTKKPGNPNEPGLLRLAALPAAEVYLDGKMQGTTNEKKFGAQGIRLDPGTYMLRLKRKGYKTEEQAIQIRPGEMRQINITLSKQAELVELSIQTNKIPSTVVIEEVKSGGRRRELPMAKHSLQINLKAGAYKVTVSHDAEAIVRSLELTEDNKSITFNADFK
ncbi:MAG: protein kinase [Oligoflexus sp.]|nr:protein kinase [Oligoflexus sp.]